MKVQVCFYLKQTRWRLMIGFLAAFVLAVFAPQWAQPNMPVPALLTEPRELKMYELSLDYVIKDYQPGTTDKFAQSVPSDIRLASWNNARRLKTALSQRDYQKANKLTLQILEGSNQDINKELLIPFGYRTPGTDVSKVYEYLLKNHINSSPAATQRSDAVNAVALLMGSWGSHQDVDGSVMEPGVAFYLTLVCLCLVFGALFSHSASNDTESFERNLPVSEMRRQFGRAIIQLLVIDLLIVSAIVASICFVAILPGHNLGDPRYPLAVIVKGKTVLVPIWQYYGRWLLLVNLWGVLLAGISELLSFVSRSTTVHVFVLGIFAFSDWLNLLALLPVSWQHFVPSSYHLIPEVLLQREGYATTPVGYWTTVFLVWAGVAWGLSLIAIKLRNRPVQETLAIKQQT